jgi:hypothetical protein
MREYPEVQKPTSRPSSGLSPLRRIGDSSMRSVNWNLKISALYTLPTRIWKHFVIQTKAGIFPGEAIIVEQTKIAALPSTISDHFGLPLAGGDGWGL